MSENCDLFDLWLSLRAVLHEGLRVIIEDSEDNTRPSVYVEWEVLFRSHGPQTFRRKLTAGDLLMTAGSVVPRIVAEAVKWIETKGGPVPPPR